ncbi:MAG: carboxymuconolactone decarboxylase family protein [Pseudomonadales bacterium]
MRLNEPRVAPLESDEWSEGAREVIAPLAERGPVLNIFKTLANHPDLMRRWLVFANHILGKSTLALRERELVILRIGYLCQAGYEWGQHVLIARRGGMTDDEIRSARTGPDTPGLSELDRLLLRATDELHADAHVSDATWQGLSEHLTTQQLMDLVFTVGQYNLVSMALNSFGVQADDGLPGWDV